MCKHLYCIAPLIEENLVNIILEWDRLMVELNKKLTSKKIIVWYITGGGEGGAKGGSSPCKINYGGASKISVALVESLEIF